MSAQQNLTVSQFKQQLKIIMKPIKQLIARLIENPMDSICMKIENNVYRIDGRPISIEGNEQIIEIEDGCLVSILSNGFWDTVVLHIKNGEITVDTADKEGAPTLIYPDSVVYYINEGIVNCCYVMAVNREITLFPTTKYNLKETMIKIQDMAINQFTKTLEDKLEELVIKIKVLKKMINENSDNIIEDEMNDLILTFEDAITLLPNRKFDNQYYTPEYIVDFFLKGIESIQYYERCI
ncbi:hypothetical protein EDI_026710 [Entamoeba dispar SAW760]|uniref:Uncharacterized protein n=1 Tax=Entamoeba dispar (strain ATCC PRA-260 / SAW760) TaxID=370354 RepID=B0EPX0_ENTDS|nr:uncharacterized protein EDI_026710 [Entamoeba dispar SAW760]EDR23439.1 hypothetical protein EDI_026710 [Entamoeba dispar SAW760]|eukprot:EDR23439.1 hypothetical protein EDI_026710 [Entamoeba dispar SAW760]